MSDEIVQARPNCKEGCGKFAALRNGELAYKGFCAGCYKKDVDARRAAKSGSATGKTPEFDVTLTTEPGTTERIEELDRIAAAQAASQEESPTTEPEGPRRNGGKLVGKDVPCGSCLTGHHYSCKRRYAFTYPADMVNCPCLDERHAAADLLWGMGFNSDGDFVRLESVSAQ